MFGQNLKKRKRFVKKERKITSTITLFPCSAGVVDEPESEYGRRWPRIIPKPLILSAPVTYQPMLPTHNV